MAGVFEVEWGPDQAHELIREKGDETDLSWATAKDTEDTRRTRVHATRAWRVVWHIKGEAPPEPTESEAELLH